MGNGETDLRASVARALDEDAPDGDLTARLVVPEDQWCRAELRAKAERELGPKFDVRDFHAQVLMSGALPLAVLEGKIDRWIAAKKAG